MAVLLECANCYQNYAAPKGDDRSPVCPWCGAVADDEAAPVFATGFPQLSPSRFPRRRRTLPALAWLVIGIGLGACVAVIVLMLRQTDSDPVVRRSPLVPHEARNPAPRIGPAAKPSDWPQPARAIAATPNSVELVRRLVREELHRAGSPDPSEPREAPWPNTKRWLSNRPPPIDDPVDDSPPLGMTLRERVPERLGAPPNSPDPANSATAPAKQPAPERRQDDPAAIAALAAAGIRCDKDAVTGLVTRVDGSFRMNDALMAHLAKLPGLVELKLSFSEVTDAGLAHIKDLTELRELILNQTKVTDAGLANLAKLVQLEKLDLEKTLVTDASLELLRSLKRLQHIDLRGTKVTQAGIDGLKKSFATAKIRY
jgi:hypothetical protein